MPLWGTMIGTLSLPVVGAGAGSLGRICEGSAFSASLVPGLTGVFSDFSTGVRFVSTGVVFGFFTEVLFGVFCRTVPLLWFSGQRLTFLAQV